MVTFYEVIWYKKSSMIKWWKDIIQKEKREIKKWEKNDEEPKEEFNSSLKK